MDRRFRWSMHLSGIHTSSSQQSRDMDFRRMSVDASMGPPRQFLLDSYNGASHQMWNTGNAARQFSVEPWHSQDQRTLNLRVSSLTLRLSMLQR
ncbi:hypothetical protein DL89DRAFT_178737 [Linderina pennispora]|uniref:Uncharacterized protein n=1 Tax=Linderina pennispora TaxID=61395 RepID=A0A1Y1W587_9FUNG|nr:uncharacterized protein DL89DRAFT_178737 [Linderina pennispora]ORX68515.1 hypothetical protein DL89DRAFT_178737 [Linderina pennispora]